MYIGRYAQFVLVALSALNKRYIKRKLAEYIVKIAQRVDDT